MEVIERKQKFYDLFVMYYVGSSRFGTSETRVYCPLYKLKGLSSVK